MTYLMKPITYDGDLPTQGKIPSELLDLILEKDTLIELQYGQEPYHVILSVPHQAANGITEIAENWRNPRNNKNGRDSDEGAATFALAAFAYLRNMKISCKLVIAAHATDHDPNKDTKSPYCQSIFSGDQSALLFECHGAAASRCHDLELSAGSNRLSDPLRFGSMLAQELEYRDSIAGQITSGSVQAILFEQDGKETKTRLALPGLYTDSLIEAQRLSIPALHLEAKPKYRKPSDEGNIITQDGLRLGRAIAKTIAAYLKPDA
jgi:hypothetical protein